MRTEQEKISRRLWDKENIDKVRAMRKRWYYKHREKILQERKKNNPHRNIVLKERRRKNPWRVMYDNHVRRTATKDLQPTTIQLVYEDNIKQHGTLTCYLCLQPILFGKDHLEHKVPLSRGGNNQYENLAVSCQSCNCAKHNKTVEEFKQYRREYVSH